MYRSQDLVNVGGIWKCWVIRRIIRIRRRVTEVLVLRAVSVRVNRAEDSIGF